MQKERGTKKEGKKVHYIFIGKIEKIFKEEQKEGLISNAL